MKLILSALLLLSFNSFAEVWKTNIDHSEIHFKIPYMKISEVSGRFREFRASGELDENKLKNIEVVIDSSSIDTSHKMRDNHLKGHDFFKAKDFPQIVFKSDKVIPLGNSKYTAEGKLTIKDISKTSTFTIELSENLKDTWGYENRFAKFSGEIDRRDFEMNWNKTLDQKDFLVGDTISISGVFQIQPAASLTPNSKHMIPDTEEIRQKDSQRQDESGVMRKLRKLINGK